MARLIAPNGCMFCEREQWNHWSRIDDLHPSGVWTWVEPSDKLRLERMRRNRMVRRGITMRLPAGFESGWAYYNGTTRWGVFLPRTPYKIVDVSINGNTAALDVGIHGTKWVAFSSLNPAAPPKDTVIRKASEPVDFLDPNKGTLENLDAEISRIEERLTALRAARAVVASL